MAIAIDPRTELTQRVSSGNRFRDVFKNAYFNVLGHRGEPNNPTEINALSTTQDLASRFIDQYQKELGKLPTEDQVRNFLGETISQGFAAQTLTGEISPETVHSSIVNPAVSRFKETQGEEQAVCQLSSIIDEAKKSEAERQSTLDAFAKEEEGQAIRSAQEQFGQQKGRLIQEEAALGRLRQPASIIPAARLEQEQAKALTNLISQIRSRQLGLRSDVLGESQANISQARQFSEDLGLRKKSLSEQIRQFNQGLQFGGQQLTAQNALAGREEDLARYLGRLQAEAQEPSLLSKIFMGAQIAKTALPVVKAIGGAAVGGIKFLGESNESFCSLVAIKNALKEFGINKKMSDIFKVIEDKNFMEIDYGYLTPLQIVSVLDEFGLNATLKYDSKLNGKTAICGLGCQEYYGIKNEDWMHAVVVTKNREIKDGYEHCLISEYPNGRELVDNANNFDWNNWKGILIEVEGRG